MDSRSAHVSCDSLPHSSQLRRWSSVLNQVILAPTTQQCPPAPAQKYSVTGNVDSVIEAIPSTMDLFSVGASVGAIIQLSNDVFSACAAYVGNFQDAPNELRDVMIEAGNVKSVMAVAQVLIDSRVDEHTVAPFPHLSGERGPIKECERVLAQLIECFPLAERVVDGRKRRLGPLLLDRLEWPRRRSTVDKLLSRLKQLRSNISLALSTETS